MLNKWQTLKKEDKGDFKIFDLEIITRKNPADGKKGDFTVVKSGDWVNMIPITKENEIVLVEQYRHGTDSIELEIPGGLVERHEVTGDAAKRECLEETGYWSDSPAEFLGGIKPNPAFMTNNCYTFLWRDCYLKSEQNLDNHEDIEVVKYPIEELKSLILSGKIRHGVIVAALNFLFLRTK